MSQRKHVKCIIGVEKIFLSRETVKPNDYYIEMHAFFTAKINAVHKVR